MLLHSNQERPRHALFHRFSRHTATQTSIQMPPKTKRKSKLLQAPCMAVRYLHLCQLEPHHIDSAESVAAEDTVLGFLCLVFFSSTYDPQTVCVMESFILAMVQYPDVYKKAQEEIDRVIGNERLLTINDRPFLPYFDCILKEVLR
jgi:hypothetical protein